MNTTTPLIKGIATALALVAATALFPREVYPCGGCFSPPGQQNGQLIVQNAERVFFYKDPANKRSVAWVEVRYSGLAKDFGWVLPLPAVPKVSVGTSWVFDQMDQRFAPSFQTTVDNQDENCRSWDDYCYGNVAKNSGIGGGRGFGAPTAGSAQDSAAESSNKDDGVKVLAEDAAGPYNYQVIAASDATILHDWLNKNGYATPKKAIPVIESHLKKGDVFVAVKLQSGTGANMIRPIVLEMEGAEACVPLRLTSIAAADDMSVVTTIAGPGRAIPKNMMHVRVNPMKLNWFSGGNNYQQVLSEAIDEAAGHAFVTEFSGDASKGVMSQVESMSAAPFKSALNARDLAKAIAASKVPLTTDATNTLELATGLAKLAGQTPQQYFGALRNCANFNRGFEGSYCGKIMADAGTLPVDGPKVFKMMDKDYIQPIQKLNKAVKASKKISRLVMRISPEEMDRDPIFSFNADLPDVDNKYTATFRRVCSTGWYPYDQVRLTIPKVGSWVFDGQLPGEFGTTNVGNNAIDKRFVTTPMAWNIEVMEESGQPHQVHSAEIDLVDGLITNSQIGSKTVPKGYELKTGGKRWSPPKNDATRTFVKKRDDRDCPVSHAIKPWEVNGSSAAAAVVPADPSMSSMDGGCTASGFGSSAPMGSALVAAMAFLFIFFRRRVAAWVSDR